jgi:hypothetical protein
MRIRGWRAAGLAGAIGIGSVLVIGALLQFLAPDLAYQLRDRARQIASGNGRRTFRIALGATTGSSYRMGTVLNRYLQEKSGYQLELLATAAPGNVSALLDPNDRIDLATINSADDDATKASSVVALAALEPQYSMVFVPSASPVQESGTRLITASAMGPVRLGVTLDEARRALPGASFRRRSDGDGAALVEIAFGQEDKLSVWADEDDPASPIDWSKRIVTIETFSAAFHTRDGIHPGSLVTEAARLFGPVREIVKSEIESREYVTFARQPRTLTFRLDYTGIFSPGRRQTTSFAPGAKISSIAISSDQ